MARAASAFAPDLTVVLAAPPIDPAGLGAPSLGAIRLHLGLRPGRDGEGPPAFWELYDERPELGCTIHRVDPEASPDRSSSAGAFPGASPPSAAPRSSSIGSASRSRSRR